jgi:5-formyltetrahydrofolate cyclo-ligase
MNESPAERKAILRREICDALKRLSPAQHAADSVCLVERLREQSIWREARSVLLFLPIGLEPAIGVLLDDALAAGKIVALPRFVAATDSYEPARIESPSTELASGPSHIQEPASRCPNFPANRLDFVLVPGIGFSLAGGRLGRGKGHYDRLLAKVPGWKCGVAFDCQLIAEPPMEPHDVRLNCILTPTRWQVVSPAPVLR